MKAAAILLLAFYFWWIETRYFGWNIWPESPAEVVCDGIVCLLCALALLAQ